MMRRHGRASGCTVMAGLDPAIHLLRKKFLRRMMDHPKSGLPDFGRFKCASRVNPTCVVKPAGDDAVPGRDDFRRDRGYPYIVFAAATS
jgi:hypothetical protein